MSSTGYVRNGVYHKAKKVPIAKMVIPRQSMFQQSDHARQRFDHSAEILQPYDFEGKPNSKFVEAYPDAAAEYGFVPQAETEVWRESDTPGPNDPGFGGSIPWGQAPTNQ